VINPRSLSARSAPLRVESFDMLGFGAARGDSPALKMIPGFLFLTLLVGRKVRFAELCTCDHPGVTGVPSTAKARDPF